MSSYYYRQSEPNLWTVGIDCGDDWFAESDHSTPEAAAQRVHWLNGGSLPNAPQPSREREALKQTERILTQLPERDWNRWGREAVRWIAARVDALSESEVGDES